MSNSRQIKLSAIVSTYNSERFIRGCLEDLISQTLYKKGELEIVIVNSASEENEEEIIKEFLSKYENIKYIKTKEREGVYAAWNRGIKASSGKYITNANTDDRHKKNGLEILVSALENNPWAVLAYGNSLITENENESFENCTVSGYLDWPDFDKEKLLEFCFIGPHPVWRRSLHEEFGYFNEDLISAGDYEFWLRIAQKYQFIHVNEYVGLYWLNENTVSRKGDIPIIEAKLVQAQYKKIYHVYQRNDKNIKSQKKILFVIHNFIRDWNAGVENYTFSLAKLLKSVGIEVAIFYPKIDANSSPKIISENYDGIATYRLITNEQAQLVTEVNSAKYNDIFENFLKEGKFDIVHFHHFYGLPLSFAEIVKKLDIKLFLTLHDFWLICPRIHFFINGERRLCNIQPDPLNCAECLLGKENKSQLAMFANVLSNRERKVKEILNSADFISAPSKFVVDKFSYLRTFKPIEVVPLGLNPVENRENKKRNEIVFGYIGSIAPVKNVLSLVKTFKNIARKNKLLIFGNGLQDEINLLEAEISGSANIKYYGSYNPRELNEIFSKFDVLIIPSFLETYSFTVREALSAGKFVIASNVGGIPDIITHEKNGLLFSPFMEGELSRAVNRVIEHPEIFLEYVNHKTEIRKIEDDAKYWSELYRQEKISPKVSIIIPVFNKVELTKDCLNSLLENTVYPNYEVIVVDNASTDGTKEFLKNREKIQSNLKVIYNEKNLGFAKANNIAADVAEGKYLVFLNNDTQVQKFWLSALVEVVENDEEVFAVGSKLLFPNRTIQHAGVVVLNAELNILPVHYLYQYPQNTGVLLKPRLFQVLTGASLLVRKEKFFEVEKFNESFWNGYEDVDLCFKLQELGGKLIYEPRSIVIHYESQSGPERFKAMDKNTLILNNKWKEKINYDFRIINDTAKKNNFTTLNSYYPKSIINRTASIIIVTYNSENEISSCLDSVLKTIAENDEIIVVDNASVDNSVSVVQEYQDRDNRIKLISNQVNYGFSKGCNIGIKNSSNPFVVFLNPDTRVYGNWLEKLIVHFNDPKVGAVGPVSDYVAGLQKVKFYLPERFDLSQPEKIISTLEKFFSGGEIETPLLIGFCLAIKRETLNRIGLLDENLFLGNDDLELSWRLRMFGYKLIVAIDTFVSHLGQQSFNSLEKSKSTALVKDSTNALYRKLQIFYGKDNVPTPMNLWRISWFEPENPKFNSKTKLFEVKPEYKSYFNIKEKKIVVSIIVPVFNQKEYTQKFLTSIGETIPLSVEIIIVDNNSAGETNEFLFSYQQTTENIILIQNKENLGFPKAINQGLKIARGEYIVIANNDIVLTENWLLKMISHAEKDETIGIVGPLSNRVSGVQFVKNANYNTIEEMHDFANKITVANAGKSFEFPRVAFLCTLIKRKVIETIGGLDERFTPGNYEDDDYCLRAQLAGFKTVIAQDVFIHHYGSKSFKADGENKYANILEVNKRKFISKWGGTPDDIWLKGKEPKSVDLFIPLSETFHNFVQLANKELQKNNYEKALDYFEKAIEFYEPKYGVKLKDLLMLAIKIAKLLNKLDKADFYSKRLEEIEKSKIN